MAESELAAAAEISPMDETEATTSAAEEAAVASESPPPPEDEAPPKKSGESPKVSDPSDVISSEPDEISASASDHKRKLEDLDVKDDKIQESKGEIIASPATGEEASDVAPMSVQKAPEALSPIPGADPSVEVPPKRQRVDEETDGPGLDGEHEVQKLEAPLVGNGQVPSTEDTQPVTVENLQMPNPLHAQQTNPLHAQRGTPLSAGQQLTESHTSSRKFEIPNNKVGVLIGKAGETIRILQQSSGAKIQITRDFASDPNSTTRPVELIGTPESINKAEQLIKDVIAEAEAGGSPALVARGFGIAQAGTEQHEMRVPNEKVGMIIGKGGETIKNLQTRSFARIQLIPQHLPEGDVSKERTVRVTGTKKQIDAAKEMIKEAMNQAPGRSSSMSGGHGSQHSFRPRGANLMPQWGSRAPAPSQQSSMGYDYQQRGTYPAQGTQYSQPYSSSHYAKQQQQPPRSTVSTGWDQRSATHPGGYGYYSQGGQAMESQSPNPAAGAPSSAPVNYNYGQSQPTGYEQQAPYAQAAAPTQQSYGQGYDDQTQQQYYGQQAANSQAGGAYPQQGQSGYAQQQAYGKPAAYGAAPQSYAAAPRGGNQPGDPMYGPTQQSYPYGQQQQQAAAGYGQAAYGQQAGTDGYAQQAVAAGGYPQQSSQVAPGYGQPAGGAPATYSQQPPQSAAYGQYPSTQPSYGDQQSVANTGSYGGGYQGGGPSGPADVGYGGGPSSGYSTAPAPTPAPASNQAGYGYAQPQQQYQSGYEQQQQQPAGYGSAPPTAGYTKGLSPQPGYGGQYDSAQMYGQH